MSTYPRESSTTLDSAAESYVKLVLALGRHDSDYVDAYHGPPAWKADAARSVRSLESILEDSKNVRESIADSALPQHVDDMVGLRRQYLLTQLAALSARCEQLGGKKFSFDEEARALYDASPPNFSEDHFHAILRQLEGMIPGTGPLIDRLELLRKSFIIPPTKLDSVFSAAIDECRSCTKRHLSLPEEESFRVEYVTNKSWSGYNWFKGNAHSLIQVNTDLPIFIERAVDLAAHEGYPGHHVYNSLLEEHLARRKNWVEFTVYALFSPQSLIAEGTANFGIDVVFPGVERTEYEKRILFPLAGIEPGQAELYYAVQGLLAKLSYAGNEAARRYLDGMAGADETAEWLTTFALMSRDRAKQRVRFFDQYRSYVINYNLGQDLVRRYVEARGGTASNSQKRWEEFGTLISSPRLPSGLV